MTTCAWCKQKITKVVGPGADTFGKGWTHPQADGTGSLLCMIVPHGQAAHDAEPPRPAVLFLPAFTFSASGEITVDWSDCADHMYDEVTGDEIVDDKLKDDLCDRFDRLVGCHVARPGGINAKHAMALELLRLAQSLDPEVGRG